MYGTNFVCPDDGTRFGRLIASVMRNDSFRSRQGSDREEPDQWLLDAARRAGHTLPDRERPAGTTAWRMLLSAGVPEEEVLRIACAASGTEPADFSQLSPSLGTALPHSVALKHRVAPLRIERGTLSVATSNPRDTALERELAFAARQRVRLCAASPTDVIRAQGVVYATVFGTRGDSMAPVMPGPPVPVPLPVPPAAAQPRPEPPRRLSVQTPPHTDTPDESRTPAEPAPVAVTPLTDRGRAAPPRAPTPELADRLLATACAERASDVLLEPTPDGGFLVRFRVDGTVNDRFRIPPAHAPRLVQALKQRARLDEDDVAHPQRGRTTCDAPGGPVSVRVSTEPSDGAIERVVLRLFAASDLRTLDQLGYAPAEHLRLRQLLGATSGLILVAGPAGAGKTTTLYAAAGEARAQGRAVATVEELVEYPLENIEQTQLTGSRVTLASAVRGVLAADGDVVVIGATLDAETLAQCDASASHRRLVLASLDTSDLGATLARLVELHPARAGLAPVLVGIVVQRLVRRLCESCAAPEVVSELPEPQQRLLYGLPTHRVRRPVGCAVCRNTGYMGRAALAEVVVMTPELRKGITAGAATPELARLALRTAKTTLWSSGIDRVLEGVTSLGELLDTVRPPRPDDGEAPQPDIDSLLTQLLGTPASRTRAAAPEDLGEVDDALPAGEEMPPAPEQPVAPAGPLRVLVVNDDAAVRRALAEGLAAAGFAVLQAASGEAALAYVRRLRPDVVLTEVALPGLDAVGLLGALAADPSPPPVIVHTEQQDDALDAWLHESGARAVLRRGVSTGEIAEVLRNAVDAR